MKLLVLDGNSVVNRAYYGIRLLSNKEGIFTNGIYGFLNILFRLIDTTKADGVAVAFDLHAPTFRHKKYSEYKAGRKPMPEELRMQIPLLKDILKLMGYKVLECEGYEADDILGTLALSAQNSSNTCFIATGDRDSLQLVGNGVSVLLASTKAGHPELTVYDEAKIMEDYGVTPPQLIEIKALQGDSSDNIPGVAGVGPKTAGGLIQQYKSIDYIYENIESLEIKDTLRQKLINDKDNAFLSRDLGTIFKEVPIPTDYNDYYPAERKDAELKALLSKLELYKIIDKMGLNQVAQASEEMVDSTVCCEILEGEACLDEINARDEITVLYEDDKYYVLADGKVYTLCSFDGLLNHRAIITHDSKTLYSTIKCEAPLNITMDTMLGAYLLTPDSNDYSLSRLCVAEGISEPQNIESKLNAIETVAKIQREKLAQFGQEKLLSDIEIPLAFTLYRMEQEGFAVDIEGIVRFGEKLQERIDTITTQIYQIIGYEFNLNSPKQLGEALFVKLGLPHGKKTKTGYSTSAEVLESLRYSSDAVELLLEYRSLAKLKSTYCDGLSKVVCDDGRIHSTFKQTEARTGRISSTEPNLQNIPIRTELGSQLRKYFVAKEGCVLLDADYSQIELRVLAHMAQDKTMCEAFLNNADIHTATAAQVFGVSEDMVTPQMRSRAKAVNFGIVYGIGAFSLSKDIGVTVAQAKEYIAKYMESYSGVARYMEEVVARAKETGFVTTIFERRRYLPELVSSNFNLRAFGERVARNMPIQGTAADIIKIAMNRVCTRLREEKLKSKLILQVHDELLCEVPLDEKEQVAKILNEEMENAVSLSVPMLAEVHWGENWYESK